MGIYSTLKVTRSRAIEEILSRLMSASDGDLEGILFSATRDSMDPLYFNNFTVGTSELEEEEE